jgi:hypothetical protein
METIRQGIDRHTSRPPAFGSTFPSDAVGRIFRPSRSAMTSGRARTREWKLVFERRTPPFIEPLMGWTGGCDTLAQVELTFPTRQAAVAYAERQGLAYVVESQPRSPQQQNRVEPTSVGEKNSCDVPSAYLDLAWLHTRYGVGGPLAPVM